MPPKKKLRLAVVGFGPRALGALEALVSRLVEQNDAAEIDIYDAFGWPGAGPNYNPEQSALCILNIPVRVVSYEPPKFMASRIKNFSDWSDGKYKQDDFPPRSEIGAYFHARFQALKDAASNTVVITDSNTKITGLEPGDGAWVLTSEEQRFGPYDEVLLAQGQPRTEPDSQLDRWITHASDHNLTLLPAYPANTLIAAARGWNDKTVAIRGLGLSTLDVLRVLTTGLGGTFHNGQYEPSGREPKRLLPFSLDGRPPAAKPATIDLDETFDPTDKEREHFRVALANTISQQPQVALETLCDALISPTVRILSELGSDEMEEDVRIWLEIERTSPGTQNVLGTIESLKADIEMAYGRAPPTAGYVLGQVWRKLQHELRDCFNQSQHEIETAIAVVGFDEGFKRFSYGPPVFAAEELLILIEDGFVSLCTVDDPAVLLSDNGWQLIEGEDARTASIMVDAVIPSPSLGGTKDLLLLDCVSDGLVTPIADGFGARTRPNGQLVREGGEPVPGLSMLGRLTIGSVIAVDGLDDCFGPSTVNWADGVFERMGY